MYAADKKKLAITNPARFRFEAQSHVKFPFRDASHTSLANLKRRKTTQLFAFFCLVLSTLISLQPVARNENIDLLVGFLPPRVLRLVNVQVVRNRYIDHWMNGRLWKSVQTTSRGIPMPVIIGQKEISWRVHFRSFARDKDGKDDFSNY